MKLWTKEGIEASEKGLIVAKDWIRKNRHHPIIKMTPIQILDLVTLVEQGFDDIKYYLPRFEEMQKTLEWYAGEQYGQVMFYPPIPDIPILHDCGDRARACLKGETQ